MSNARTYFRQTQKRPLTEASFRQLVRDVDKAQDQLKALGITGNRGPLAKAMQGRWNTVEAMQVKTALRFISQVLKATEDFLDDEEAAAYDRRSRG